MGVDARPNVVRERVAPLEMDPDTFRALGHHLVDRIADFLATLPERPVYPGESPAQVRAALGQGPLPEQGENPWALLDAAADLLFEHSLFNGHPRFWGYITASAAPIGTLGDLLAAAVNPNVGGWDIAPIATEIEVQTVQWIAELLGYPSDCGGLLTSGGNMANFVGFWVARHAKTAWDVRECGLLGGGGTRLCVYGSHQTHTWIEKAADLSGLGRDAIRWIPTDDRLRIDVAALRGQIDQDLAAGDLPFLVVGTAGSTGTGSVDPLPELAAICREHDLWFHVDGAYGAPAAALPDAPTDLKGLVAADSVAVDPHKWLYAPLEAGCTLVRDRQLLRDTFSYIPPYYPDDEDWFGGDPPLHYLEYGPQNSRGFRALKVWLALRQVGREGYVRMISDDIELARHLYDLAEAHPELQAFTHNLSITTFRYVPRDLQPGTEAIEAYLSELNKELEIQLQNNGEVYLSHALIDSRYLLRLCIVNFRTSLADIEALPDVVARTGRALDAALRPPSL